MFTVLAFLNRSSQVKLKEKNYADIVFLPFMNAITKSLGQTFEYEHREALLISMADLLLRKKVIKQRSEAYNAYGIVRFLEDEICVIEVCGTFGNTLLSKIQFDRHKAAYGLLAMLKCLANKYEYGSVETFQKLEMKFIHTKDNTIQSWALKYINDIPSKDTRPKGGL